MKFEYLKEYKTRGGWKAVYMGESDEGLVFVHYKEDIYAVWHEDDGIYLIGKEHSHDITGEWSEPKTGVVYVYEANGEPYAYTSPELPSGKKPIASVRWTEGEFIDGE